MFNLGSCYYLGKGIERNLETAISCYRRAANAGHLTATTILGDCYGYGVVVDRDLEEAVKLYRQAAEEGIEEAKAALERLGEEL